MIERWLDELVATPGLTAVSGEDARRVHLDESLAALEPVERKVVHVQLKDVPGVVTRSEGTEPNRFVVIDPV